MYPRAKQDGWFKGEWRIQSVGKMRWVIGLSAMVALAYLSLLAEAIHYAPPGLCPRRASSETDVRINRGTTAKNHASVPRPNRPNCPNQGFAK